MSTSVEASPPGSAVDTSQARTYDVLEAARGLSAVMVALSHARPFVMNDYGPHAASPLGLIFYAVAGLGHAAVIIFFVLSGFLISGSVTRSLERGTWSWRNYLVARVGRLHAVAIPCLALTFLIDSVTMRATGSSFYQGLLGSYHSGPMADGVHLDAATFLANVAFLQTIVSPVFGSNGPLWSLAYEFWYYLLFPMTMVVATRYSSRRYHLELILAGAIAAVGIAAGSNLLTLYAAWYAGRLSRQLSDAAPFGGQVRWLAPLAAFGMLATLGLSRTQVLPVVAGDLLLAGIVALFFAFTSKLTLPDPLFVPIEFLAKISYSLYLIHFPVMASAAAFVLDNRRLDFSATSVALVFGFCLIGIAAGTAVYALFERRTALVRQWLGTLVGLACPPRSA